MKKIIFFALVCIVMLGCNKGSDDCTLNNSSILGTYIMTGYTYQASTTSPVIDEFATYPACAKDNVITFKANSIYTFDEGVLTCPSSVTGAGTWRISGNTLTLDYESYTTTFNCKTLVIKTTGNTDIETATLTKQ